MRRNVVLLASLIALACPAGSGADVVTVAFSGTIDQIQQQSFIFPFGSNTTFAGSLVYDDAGNFENVGVTGVRGSYSNSPGGLGLYEDVGISLALLDHDTSISYDFSRSYNTPTIYGGSATASVAGLTTGKGQGGSLPESFQAYAEGEGTVGGYPDRPAATDSLALILHGLTGMLSSTALPGLVIDPALIGQASIDYQLYYYNPAGGGGTYNTFHGRIDSLSITTSAVPEPLSILLLGLSIPPGILIARRRPPSTSGTGPEG